MKTKFGTMRGGHPTPILLSLSAILGLAVAVALGFVAAWRTPQVDSWLVILITAACTAPVLATAAWALLVDLGTVAGRADRVEESIESHWANEALSGMATDNLLTLGLLTAVVSIGRVELPTQHLLLGLLLLNMASFGVRYLVAQRKGS